MLEMKKTLTLAAALLLSAGAAFADDPTVDSTPFTAVKSRADVQAELVQFRTGANPWSTRYDPFAALPAVKTRAAVQAERVAARDSGEIAAMTGEDSGSTWLAQHQPRSQPASVLMARQ
jgi:hypothetical protein